MITPVETQAAGKMNVSERVFGAIRAREGDK